MRGFALVACTISALSVLTFNVPLHAATLINVSPGGTDNGSCGASGTPCKTLQRAINRAAAGDTVKLQQAGDYGFATIDKKIDILGVQGAGVFSPPNTPCIIVQASESDYVTISELTCDQAGAAQDGILFNSGRFLRLDNVIIRGGTGGGCGVSFRTETTSGLSIANSTITEFSGSNATTGVASGGVCIAPGGSGDASGQLTKVNLEVNGHGFRSNAASGAGSSFLLEDCLVANNQFVGIVSQGNGSDVYVHNSRVALNGRGLFPTQGGALISEGGNAVIGNNTDGTFTSTKTTE
jgi:hypothetical protein